MRFAGEKKMAAWLLLCVALASLPGCAGYVPGGGEAEDRGWVSREILQTPPYAPFQAGYDSARIAPEFVPMIRSVRPAASRSVTRPRLCTQIHPPTRVLTRCSST